MTTSIPTPASSRPAPTGVPGASGSSNGGPTIINRPSASGRCFNYSAGPGALPEDVLRQAQKDLWDIFDSGVGILEHSHRRPVFDRVLSEALADFREVGSIPDDYSVMFLQGGASSQFHMIPMNFLSKDKSDTADYFDTGEWSHKAIREAKLFGNIHLCGDSSPTKYDHIPKGNQVKYSPNAKYCYFESNSTVFGIQFHQDPTPPPGVELVVDACSDMFWKPVDVRKYALYYAGAQKNLGPAGTVIVVARRDFLERGHKDLPWLLQYRTFDKEQSRPNTPSTFGIYLVGQMIKWIKREGGLKAMEQINRAKAGMVYDHLDNTDFYIAPAKREDRSMMNVLFRCRTPELDKQFCAEAEKRGLDALAGHRSTGGMRASLYNSMPLEGAKALVAFMKDFETKHR
jgi:phosphoserine aminotransferase